MSTFLVHGLRAFRDALMHHHLESTTRLTKITVCHGQPPIITKIIVSRGDTGTDTTAS